MPRQAAAARVGVDVGGTFTDFVVDTGTNISTFKISSSPGNPADAVIEGLKRIGIEPSTTVVHGSTVATNAVLERRGARTVLVTTTGFRDVLEIGRQQRSELYAISPSRPPVLIDRKFRLEVDERVGADGTVLHTLDPASLEKLVRRVRRLKPEAAAVCLLFSFLRPSHERTVRAALRKAGVRWVSISSEVLPEHREYERSSTTAVDAYVGPVMGRYIGRLERAIKGRLWIVQSNGGVLKAAEAVKAPVQSVLSGPAAGVEGARTFAVRSGFDHIVTLDMGGTSTDVAICPGQPLQRRDAEIGGLPIAIPMTDIHTVGAGGGSIAGVDDAGSLRVGPQSAGAEPGPAAYGRGGTEPTVTDANVVLGRISGVNDLADDVEIDQAAAARAMDRLLSARSPTTEKRRRAAATVVDVANAHMERALRVITLERGYDPRDFVLVAFGGAGPLHGCDLADRLQMSRVLVPRYPGVLSALGALSGEHRREYAATLLRPAKPQSLAVLRKAFERLERNARRDFLRTGRPKMNRSLELRYVGQSFELGVPIVGDDLISAVKAFHQRHQDRFAHSRPDADVEMVVARLAATVPQAELPFTGAPGSKRKPGFTRIPVVAGGSELNARAFVRDTLPIGFRARGPVVIEQDDATTWVPPGWRVQVDGQAALILDRHQKNRL